MLVLAGCADRAAGPAAPAAVPLASGASAAELVATTYRLGSGDRIKLTVFRHEDLSGEFALDGAGNFSMPLIGEIQAYGLTTRELETADPAKARRMAIWSTRRSAIEVLNYRPFYILGEVKAPGSYPYVNGMTVLNAVALAGGFSYRAKQERLPAAARRQQLGQPRSAATSALLPGDIVTVQERFF